MKSKFFHLKLHINLDTWNLISLQNLQQVLHRIKILGSQGVDQKTIFLLDQKMYPTTNPATFLLDKIQDNKKRKEVKINQKLLRVPMRSIWKLEVPMHHQKATILFKDQVVHTEFNLHGGDDFVWFIFV